MARAGSRGGVTVPGEGEPDDPAGGRVFPGLAAGAAPPGEAALVTVVATSHLLGSRPGGWKSWSPRWASTG
jgi:hypothetical protein